MRVWAVTMSRICCTKESTVTRSRAGS
jgi:hypothetical protein